MRGKGGTRRELAGRKRGAERRIDQLAKISSISSFWEEEDKEGREELHEDDDHGLVGETMERRRGRCDM